MEAAKDAKEMHDSPRDVSDLSSWDHLPAKRSLRLCESSTLSKIPLGSENPVILASLFHFRCRTAHSIAA